MTDIINDVENNNKVSSDSSNERKRRTKKELYQKERDDFINELNKFIKFNGDNYILMSELQENNEFNKFILDNIDTIKKIWNTSTWSYFINDEKKSICLYKSIINNSNYKLYSKQKLLTQNGEKKKYTVYYIEKK